MPDTRHILASYDAALTTLRSDVLRMGSLTAQALSNAAECLLERNDETCNRTIADDDEIDQLEKKVGRVGVELLLRYQPVAADLREVIAAMRLCSDIERVADQAVNIAKKARKLAEAPPAEIAGLLGRMFAEAIAIFRDSLKAYADTDVDLALALKARDRKIDALNVEVSNLATEQMARLPGQVADLLNLILMARHLERVGDHAKNIGEDAVYIAEAEDIRHARPTPGI
jgi:phosphate transport system protein